MATATDTTATTIARPPADQLEQLSAVYAARNDSCSQYVAGLLRAAARDARFVHAQRFEDIDDRMEVMDRGRDERFFDLAVGLVRAQARQVLGNHG